MAKQKTKTYPVFDGKLDCNKKSTAVERKGTKDSKGMWKQNVAFCKSNESIKAAKETTAPAKTPAAKPAKTPATKPAKTPATKPVKTPAATTAPKIPASCPSCDTKKTQEAWTYFNSLSDAKKKEIVEDAKKNEKVIANIKAGMNKTEALMTYVYNKILFKQKLDAGKAKAAKERKLLEAKTPATKPVKTPATKPTPPKPVSETFNVETFF